jgi:hypothetical protein
VFSEARTRLDFLGSILLDDRGARRDLAEVVVVIEALFSRSDVPARAVGILENQLNMYGCRVLWNSEHSGVIESSAGRLTFSYKGGALAVSLIRCSVFPRPMLVGGIRQMVEEAIELAKREA